MAEAVAIAARCAQLTDNVVKHILEAGNFARRARECRHEMNAVNTELLALQTTLEIIHDDLVGGDINIPPTLFHALSGIIQSCEWGVGHSHKIISRLSPQSASNGISTQWQKVRKDIASLRMLLDIALDVLSVMTRPSQVETNSIYSNQTSSFSLDARRYINILKRIHIESDHISRHDDQQARTWAEHLDKLRESVEIMHELLIIESEGEELQRSDSMEPEEEASTQHNEADFSPISTLSNISSTNGVGTWLAEVLAQIGQQPIPQQTLDSAPASPERATVSSPKQCTGNKKARKNGYTTFYAESIVSGRSMSSLIPKKKSSRAQMQTEGRPMPPPKEAAPSSGRSTSLMPTTIYTTSTLTSESCTSIFEILNQNTKPDKMAIASANRLALSPNQRTELDWRLRSLIASIPDMPEQDIEACLRQGANPNIEDESYGWLFIRAAYQHSFYILRLLIQYGADVSRTAPQNITSDFPYHTALHAAVAGNQLNSVQYLVEELRTPHLDVVDPKGETPLHVAIRTPGAYEIVRYLLEAGADVTGFRLQDVVKAGKVEARERSAMLELLLASGVEEEVCREDCKRRGKGLSVLGLI